MGVIRWDGADWARFSALASPLANIPTGSWTFATTYMPFAGGTVYNGLAYLCKAGPLTEVGLSRHGGVNELFMDAPSGGSYDDGAGNSQIINTANERYICVASHTSGGVVDFYLYVKSTNTWTGPFNNAATQAAQAAATMLELATWQGGSDLMNGWAAVTGIWSGKMSTPNVQALSTNWRTSDWYLNAHGTPVCLVEYNVTPASLVDLTGNATSLGITGTPVLDGAETFGSWLFDGLGDGNYSGSLATVDFSKFPKAKMIGAPTV